jgi:flagellar basal body rod protein FlgB
LVESNNLTSVDIIAALNAGGLSADEMLFLFQLIKSVPETKREEAVASHLARGTYNVDAETEANNILQIQMQYKLLTQLTNFEFSQLSIAMK